jgi:putative membrane protein
MAGAAVGASFRGRADGAAAVIPTLFLHPAAPLDLTQPSIHWSTVIGLLVIAALYWWRAAVVRRAGGDAPSTGRQAAFATALIVIFLSLNGPIHDLSDYYLFSAHMVQHLLLTLVASPLMVFGVTGDMLRPLIAPRAVFRVARVVTRPAICFAIFNVIIAFWHLPVAYNAAMANHDVHIFQHLTLIAAAVLVWWPLMSPLPELPRLSYPGQMLYCFLMVVPMSVVAIYIAMADTLLYPAYAAAPRMWGISPMMDQQIGGLIMWIPGGLFFYGIMTVVFFRWANRGEDSREAAQVGWAPNAL